MNNMELINEMVHTLGFKLSSINKELHGKNIKYLIKKSGELLNHKISLLPNSVYTYLEGDNNVYNGT